MTVNSRAGMTPRNDCRRPRTLAKLALFRSVNVEELPPFLHDCEIRSMPSGAILIEADQPNDRLYLVLAGEFGVHLDLPDSPPIVILGAGETVGELSLIDKGSTSAYVVAHEPSRVLVLSEATMWSLVTASHAISLNLLRTLSTRLRRDNRLIHEHREQLRQAQKLEALGQLTGGIAHDFNNLLALAIVDLDMIVELAHGQTRIAQLAKEARSVLQNGADLTQRLLTFARASGSKPGWSTSTPWWLRRASCCATRWGLRSGSRRCSPAKCQAWVDPPSCRTRLEPGVQRARRHARRRDVDRHRDRARRRSGSAARLEPGAFVVITVADTGHGMAPKVLERAFEPCSRPRRRRRRSGPEHGVRLRQAVRGHACIRSEVGRGTAVTLYLPHAAAGSISGEVAAKRVGAAGC